MRIIFNALFFSLVIIGVYYLVVRLPYTRKASACYTTLMMAFDSKGIIAQKAYLSDEQICLKNKERILEGVACFRTLPNVDYVTRGEAAFLDWVAKTTSRATKTQVEAVLEHNTHCQSKQSKIVYDLGTPDPFALNFE